VNDIQEYIDSGILELYVLGSASEEEERELLRYKEKFPEVKQALFELETDMERIAGQMAIKPPPNSWLKIQENLNELIEMPEPEPLRVKQLPPPQDPYERKRDQQFIEVEALSNHMRLHKSWRWVFAAVFVLGKVFLGCAIYFYLENRQLSREVEEMRLEIKQMQHVK
jgi:SHS2 domain-containing protein